MYRIFSKENQAKHAILETRDGKIETPVFMNVATVAAIKGAVSAVDLAGIGCQVVLCNTYHLHLRPGEHVIKSLGGLNKFMAWNGPTLTDSGGFQVFSLQNTRKIKEEGVYFSSHIDGRKIFMGPKESMAIQQALNSTIVMAFDECPPYPAEKNYIIDSVNRTTRWLEICRQNVKGQLLFGINQGGVYKNIRIEHAKVISDMNLDGYAIGGLAVGESHESMYEILETVIPFLPRDKPTYLMGVGTPENILEAVHRGVDFFDCVMPARNGRHGHVFTKYGKINLLNARFEKDDTPIDSDCTCPACLYFTKAYIRHLLKAKEMLGMRLAVLHNLFYYNKLMSDIRNAIKDNTFGKFKKAAIENWSSY